MNHNDAFFTVDNLSKSFGGLQAVHEVAFCVEEGSLTSFIGPNGAGKTTVFDLISGFLPADSGQIKFKGQNIAHRKPHDIVAMGMARTFQNLNLFYQLSVWDNIFLALPGKRREHLWGLFVPKRILRREEIIYEKRTNEIIDFLGLNGKAGEKVENLSWGDQKLVSIGRLLATDSEFLLFDEPVSGLSDPQIDHLKSLLRGLILRGKTILLIDHNVKAVMDISDWVFVLNFGEIITEGKPNDILSHEEVIRVYLGREA